MTTTPCTSTAISEPRPGGGAEPRACRVAVAGRKVPGIPPLPSSCMASAPVWSGTAKAVRHGVVIDEQSSGQVAGPESAPCRPGTRFQAGSISKVVLSVVVLELAVRGELNLQ